MVGGVTPDTSRLERKKCHEAACMGVDMAKVAKGFLVEEARG